MHCRAGRDGQGILRLRLSLREAKSLPRMKLRLRRKYVADMPPGGAAFLFGAGGGDGVSGSDYGGVKVAAKNGEKPTSSYRGESAAAEPAANGLRAAPQSGPALTSVVDTVYMADGTPAQGVLVITWPAFVAANGSGGGGGVVGCDAGNERRVECSARGERGRRTPAGVYYTVVYQLGPERSANRILGGADEFSGNAGAGADDAGSGNGGAAGIDAVRKFGTGGEGERQRGGASGGDGDGDWDQKFCCAAECADAGGYGGCDEQGVCGCGDRKPWERGIICRRRAGR